MKVIEKKSLSLGGIALAFCFFSTGATAGCLENGYASEVVTEYGGSTLSCPNNHQGCTITDVISGQNCVITNPNEPDGPPSYTSIVIDVPNGDYVQWNAYVSDAFGNLMLDDNEDPIPDTDHPIDNVITDTATGANGCFQAFGTDQLSGIAGFQRDNGSYLATKATSFCTDDRKEVTATAPPPPPVVENCILEAGQQKEIYGVTFSCDGVGINQERTIIVVQDTSCDINGDNCTGIPAFGFTDGAGNIDFNNVCRCVGNNANSGGLPDILACEPDPEDPAGCEVINAEVPVDISIQNPKCFTVGGFRRCY